jgi:hypothetical protein
MALILIGFFGVFFNGKEHLREGNNAACSRGKKRIYGFLLLSVD